MEPIKCTFCEFKHSDEHDWYECSQGEMACETCQYDAAAHFGQIRDNIRHTRIFNDLILQWSEE